MTPPKDPSPEHTDDPPTEDPPAEDPAAAGDDHDGDDTNGAGDTTARRQLLADLRKERKARKDAETALDKMRGEHATDAEKALAQAHADGRTEALGEINARLLDAEVRAAAGGRLADPADAVRLLDMGALVDDDGHVDPDAVAAAVDELVEAKPYLAAKSGDERPAPRAPQGTRGQAGAPVSRTPAEDGDAFLRQVVKGAGG